MLRFHGRWMALFLLPLWLMWPHVAACSETATDSIQHMNHRTWTVINGAPADIWDMKQDGKGFLWLATGTGLFRFDGVRFERYLPIAGQAFVSTDMTALRIVSDNDFWVGTTDGVISHVKDGRVTNYPSSLYAKEGPVYCFVTTPDGAMWAVAGQTLFRYSDDTFQAVGADWNFPSNTQAMWMVVGKDGTAWLTTDRELLFLRKGSHRFEHTGIATGLYSVLALSPDGTLWISDGVHGTRALPGLSAGLVPSKLLQPLPITHIAQSMRMAFDKNGALWGTLAYHSGANGIFRVSSPSRFADGRPLSSQQMTDTYSTDQGLTSIVTVPILVDREGDVWIGTNFGLNRLHANSFNVASPMASASPVWLSPNDHGKVLLLQKGCLYRVFHAVPSKVTCDFPESSDHIFSAPDRFISETPGAFYQWSPKAGNSLLKLPGDQAAWDVTAFNKDNHGNFWLAFNGGVYRLDGNAWKKVVMDNPLGRQQPSAFAFDEQNAMWLGYPNGQVMQWNGGKVIAYSVGDGLSIGSVKAIATQGDTVLVGGDAGVARWRNGRFQSIRMDRLHVLSAVSGVAETAAGDVWLNTSLGIVRIAAGEAERAFDDLSYAPGYRLYGSDDGVPGIAFRQPLASTITTDEDGRLWFLTNQGVCWVDPSTVRTNSVAPETVIESVLAEGRQFPVAGRMVLPPHTSTISFQYTAASLKAPQNVKFRYKLSGIDKDWQDAESHREAIYANLDPGDYEFQVAAANSDGVWSENPSIVAFKIKHTFYQTRAFRLLSIAVLILCAVMVVVFQYRRMLRTLRDRIEIRHAERERIARELHDTLLQGIQGLILFFQTVPDRMPKGDPFLEKINQALDRAHEVLVEGRNRVRDLRASDQSLKDLAEAFRALGDELAESSSTNFRVSCPGGHRDIDTAIQEEIYLIGREALLNAFRHAKASAIDMEIVCDAKQFRICVRDNGVGIDPRILEAKGRSGHWGMVGMRERAKSIGGQLAIYAQPGAGTKIELFLPSAKAYAPSQRALTGWIRQIFRF